MERLISVTHRMLTMMEVMMVQALTNHHSSTTAVLLRGLATMWTSRQQKRLETRCRHERYMARGCPRWLPHGFHAAAREGMAGRGAYLYRLASGEAAFSHPVAGLSRALTPARSR
jgi:hypothetical protein